ncbi:protein mono-ADP-ribosyltransferase PARP4-like isoform X2 [Dendropsophus ebraccatus]|uniref:protein mono-ADP-ribosyltransferase PARP4-like isoform X2 n=1 Tax=Dendropsophus ebraccatus TaxID=150705 RepID=UPI003831BBEA
MEGIYSQQRTETMSGVMSPGSPLVHRFPGGSPPPNCDLPAGPMFPQFSYSASLDAQSRILQQQGHQLISRRSERCLESTEREVSYTARRKGFFRSDAESRRYYRPCNLISPRKKPSVPSWSSLSSLQSLEGYWQLSPELGTLLHINVRYLTEDYLVKKGIRSLGLRGIDTIHKLIATLLVLQIIRVHNILREIRFKTLMKLDQSFSKSSVYSNIEKAIKWAGRADRQYPGICMRLGLGNNWDQATRQLLGLVRVSATSDLYPVYPVVC